MKQHNEKNLEAEILQRIAQQMNDIAEQIAAFALDCTAAMRRVLESKALQEALQAAIQKIQASQARPLGSFAEVAAHMEGAHGQNRYQVGDIIQMNHDDFGLIKWRVIGADVDRAAGHRHTLTVAMERAETYHWFSEPSKEHPFGSNNYPGSAIRFYLNNEFFRGIPEEDAETLLTTCRPCTEHGEASSTCDLVWLLSASEVGFKGNDIPCEGEHIRGMHRATVPSSAKLWTWTETKQHTGCAPRTLGTATTCATWARTAAFTATVRATAVACWRLASSAHQIHPRR